MGKISKYIKQFYKLGVLSLLGGLAFVFCNGSISEAYNGSNIFDFSLSDTIASYGRIEEYLDNNTEVNIDANDILENRNALLELQRQMGGVSSKIFTYETTDGHIYMVTGAHTSIKGMDSDKAEVVINAEKEGKSSVTHDGDTINLIDGGNTTWQKVY